MSHKKSLRDDKVNLRWLHNHLDDMKLDDISKTVVDNLIREKQKGTVSNATVNRMLALLHAILNRAVKEWEWLDKAPHVRLLPEPLARIRWLSHNEANCLLLELPEHLADMVRFTLATG